MNRRLGLLLATALLLAGYAGWSHSGVWTALIGAATPEAAREPTTQVAHRGQPAAKAKPLATLNPLAGLDELAVAAILERPLFSPSRRPAAPLAAPAPEPVPAEEPAVVTVPQGRILSADDFTLLAVASADARKVAVVRVKGSDDVLYLREGQPLLDWRVLHVGARDVKIGDDRESITLTMFDKPPSAPDEAAEAMAPPAVEQQPDGGEATIQ